MALLLRNYICSLKSERQDANSHLESVGYGLLKNKDINEQMDDIAPWPSLQRPNLPRTIEFDDTKCTPSGKLCFLSCQIKLIIIPIIIVCQDNYYQENYIFSAKERKAFCLLAIRLIQGIDLPLQDLLSLVYKFQYRESSASNKIGLFEAKHCGKHPILEISSHSKRFDKLLKANTNRHSSDKQSYGIPSVRLDEWKKDMTKIVADGVGGLMDLSVSLEKMVSHDKRLQEDQNIPLLHRASVVGLFLRRIILCFDKLSFSEVSHLYHNFKQYYEEGKLN